MAEISEVTARYERFLAEQRAAWNDVLGLHDSLREAFTRSREQWLNGGSLRERILRVSETSRRLYLEAYERYQHCHPARRALSAIEALDSAIGIGTGFGRARIDGAMQLLMARASLRLRDPWIFFCSIQQKKLEGADGAVSQTSEWPEWLAALEHDRQAGERLLTRYRVWTEKAAASVSKSAWPRRREKKYTCNLAFWWRRQRAVSASLEVEARMTQTILESLEITRRTLDDLRTEREELRRTLRDRIQYLSGWSGGAFEPPDTDTRIISLEERLDIWQLRINRAVESRLPEQVETTEPRAAFPSVLNRWRIIEPRKTYRNALHQSARPALAASLGEATDQNFALAREMERAGEVILYAQGAAREGGEALLSEALQNAKALLKQSDDATPAETTALDGTALAVLMAAAREAGAVLEVGRAGVLALLTRRQGRRLLGLSKSFTRQFAPQAAARIGGFCSRLATAIQIKLGWKLPTRLPLPPVVHRIQLREAMDLEAASRELPALYRRLFRLSPVEDPRFLVGRDEELQGFQQAFDAWRGGRFAACLLVGARGSGKTSLLNCAASSLFSNETVVRAQFSERIAEPDQMDAFIGHLPEGRRVVILEEIERTFLKSFNGFNAIRRLQEVIQTTASSTLWILAMNDFAFHLLDQAVRLSATFSQRVNAMSVLREDLVKAILQRHNLSGLQLRFSPPPPEDPRVSRIRSFFRIREDPQAMFFDSLYEQSGGVFRSAFELWQSSIHRVEAGKVEMKQPLAPDFAPLRRELDQQDHFALFSIQQHGSLTDDELSRVLTEPVRASRLRLDRLAALDIVAPDPDHQGVRVRPEAQLFVNDLLQRINLI